MNHKPQIYRGFSLVELIVTVAIASLIMVGMSAFFTGAFSKVFDSQKNMDSAQLQFSATETMRDKLSGAEEVVGGGAAGDDYAIVRNNTEDGRMPFTYIGEDDGRLVSSDFFVFKGMYGNKRSDESKVKNPAGITLMDGKYYIAAPNENAIYKCDDLEDGPCGIYLNEGLNNPIDITTNGTDLFISDAGNNRILKVPGGTLTPIPLAEKDLNFPTGLAYDEANEALFVSDTYNNLVKRIDLTDNSVTVAAGDGDDEDCDKTTAKFCRLNFPTGLHAEGTALYIADTGNYRILKISDPGKPENETITFTLDDDTAVQKIGLSGFTGNISCSTNLTGAVYNAADREIKLDPLFQAYELVMGGCTWSLDGDTLYKEGSGMPLPDAPHNKITIRDGSPANGKMIIYSVSGGPFTDTCTDPSDNEHSSSYVTVDPPLQNVLPGFNVHTAITGGAPVNIECDFGGANITAGFTEIGIDVYKFDLLTPAEQFSHFMRVGDGAPGTPEDIIEQDGGSLTEYTTGLSWAGDLKKGEGDGGDFDPAAAVFDYISDFKLHNEPEFSQPNPDLLELSLTAIVNEAESLYETYTINAKINN